MSARKLPNTITVDRCPLDRPPGLELDKWSLVLNLHNTDREGAESRFEVILQFIAAIAPSRLTDTTSSACYEHNLLPLRLRWQNKLRNNSCSRRLLWNHGRGRLPSRRPGPSRQSTRHLDVFRTYRSSSTERDSICAKRIFSEALDR